MTIENIPLNILFEAESLKEFATGAVGGALGGYYAGHAYGRHQYAKELQHYIRSNNLDPSEPFDKKRIKNMKKILAKKYGLSSTLMGIGLGAGIGSAVGIASRYGRG